MSDEELELLPCPFCGASQFEIRKLAHGYVGLLHDCNILGDYIIAKHGTKEQVVAAWNTRRGETQ